ncbi:MAG: redoxin domain-containing protein [Bacteroidota bacterium]
MKYGIAGQKAPELDSRIVWKDEEGKPMEAAQLAHHKGKHIVLFAFQSWCPGCHSRGFPALQKMVEAMKDQDSVAFMAIQTVFEGFQVNTAQKAWDEQTKYALGIPFGHDAGSEDTAGRSSLMYHYRTGGTPWFIIIDPENRVVFNDFHLNVDGAIEYLTDALKTSQS